MFLQQVFAIAIKTIAGNSGEPTVFFTFGAESNFYLIRSYLESYYYLYSIGGLLDPSIYYDPTSISRLVSSLNFLLKASFSVSFSSTCPPTRCQYALNGSLLRFGSKIFPYLIYTPFTHAENFLFCTQNSHFTGSNILRSI